MSNSKQAQTIFPKLKIALIQVLNPASVSAMNKDLNGGFGTKDHYGNSFTSKLLMLVKKKGIRLPVISLAYLQAIFKDRGSEVKYFEETLPGNDERFDLILVYGSIVDYTNENRQVENLKKQFHDAKIGFIGPFPSLHPELFSAADFVLLGEPEAFFMNEFSNLDQLSGPVKIQSIVDMEALPSPDYDGFPISKYSYKPLINKKPFVVLQGSKGCPYSCRFYCVYGEVQGARIRQRSAKKIVDDIAVLQKKYSIKGIQFRDPLFGVTKNFISEFTEEIVRRKIKITWGIETRLDLLNEDNLTTMYNAGLRNINVGIETSDATIAKINKRLLVKESYQSRIVAFCKKKRINVSAFYILGLEGDTEQTMKDTLRYAISLNTNTAKFTISTPYPGTGYYAQLNKENRLLTHDFETYDQYTLVYKQAHLSPKQLDKFMDTAYRKYYFRLSYVWMFLKWQIRNLYSGV
jgi:radical SAM superfamily enzyme YgiQ (UPF0313 family)